MHTKHNDISQPVKMFSLIQYTHLLRAYIIKLFLRKSFWRLKEVIDSMNCTQHQWLFLMIYDNIWRILHNIVNHKSRTNATNSIATTHDHFPAIKEFANDGDIRKKATTHPLQRIVISINSQIAREAVIRDARVF